MAVLGWVIAAAAAFLVGYNTVVLCRFALRWRRARAEPSVRSLPLHVFLIALSYNLLLLEIFLQTLVLIRWWHPIVFIPAILLGFAGVFLLDRASSRERPDTLEAWNETRDLYAVLPRRPLERRSGADRRRGPADRRRTRVTSRETTHDGEWPIHLR